MRDAVVDQPAVRGMITPFQVPRTQMFVSQSKRPRWEKHSAGPGNCWPERQGSRAIGPRLVCIATGLLVVGPGSSPFQPPFDPICDGQQVGDDAMSWSTNDAAQEFSQHSDRC